METTGESQHLENTPIPGTIEPSNSSSPTRSHQSVITFLEENDRDGLRLNIRYIRRRSELLERSDGQFENRLLMLLPRISNTGRARNIDPSLMGRRIELFLVKFLEGRMASQLSRKMRRGFRSLKRLKVRKMVRIAMTNRAVKRRRAKRSEYLRKEIQRLETPNRHQPYQPMSRPPRTLHLASSRQSTSLDLENGFMSANLKSPKTRLSFRSREVAEAPMQREGHKPKARPRNPYRKNGSFPIHRTKAQTSWTICETKD